MAIPGSDGTLPPVGRGVPRVDFPGGVVQRGAGFGQFHQPGCDFLAGVGKGGLSICELRHILPRPYRGQTRPNGMAKTGSTWARPVLLL